MLKVLEYKECESTNIEYDVYTPVNIEFGSWNLSEEPTSYWRTGDFKKSLIEIGVGKYSGHIRSITLTLSENVYKTDDFRLDVKNITLKKGLPTFQMEDFKNQTYLDEIGILNVYIGDRNILLTFADDEIVSILQNENVGFALDNYERVCAIIVSDVEEHERETIIEALR